MAQNTSPQPYPVPPVIVGTTAVQIAPSNISRTSVFVYNPSTTNTIWLASSDVTLTAAGSNSIALAPGQGAQFNDWTKAMLCISSGANTAICVYENLDVEGFNVGSSGGSGGSTAEGANTVFAGPTSGLAALPTFRNLVVADLPLADVPHGGTGLATLTAHGVLVGEGASVVSPIVGGAGTLFQGNGSSADPTFTATPTLGIGGATLGTLSFANTTSGSITLQPVTGALGTTVLTMPAGTDTLVTLTATQTLSNKILLAPQLGVVGTTVGTIAFANATSGTITLQPVTGALGAAVLTLPASTDQLIGRATTDTLTNKTFDTAGTGNVFRINGTGITAVTGTGAVVLASSPALLGVPTAPTAANATNTTQLATTAYVLATRLDQLTTPTASVSFGSQNITNLLNPVNAQDAATKNYVDANIVGLQIKQTARLATTAALPTNVYNNGSSGVGATLTAVTPAVLTVDGQTANLGDYILVKNEAAPANNGLYTVTLAGAVGVAYILTRASDMNSASEFSGAFIPVGNAGTANANSLWLANPTTPVVVGTTSIPFTQLNGATDLIAGAGITISGNTISISAGAITNAMLAGSITASNLVGTDIATVGTITTGTWNGTTIAVGFGGTGRTTLTNHGVLVGAGTSAITQLAAAGTGTVLAGQGTGSDPSFTSAPTLGVAGSTVGTLGFLNATSGQITLQAATGALGSTTLLLPGTGTTDTLVTLAASQTLTSKTITAGIFTGASNFQQAVLWSGSITPTALSGSVNNYNPAGLANATVIRLGMGGGSYNITGLAAQGTGQLMVIENTDATGTMTLVNQSGSSSAANQFNFGANIALTPQQGALLRYDESNFWRAIAVFTTAGGGSGTVTSITPGAGLSSTITATAPGSAITSSGTLYLGELVNAQTGTTYTMLDTDRGKLVTFNNASAVAVTVPVAGGSSAFQASWVCDVQNLGAGTVTFTPTSCNIDGGASLAITQNQGFRLVSDGSNYFTQRGLATTTAAGLATIVAGAVNVTAASNAQAAAGTSTTTANTPASAMYAFGSALALLGGF